MCESNVYLINKKGEKNMAKNRDLLSIEKQFIFFSTGNFFI